MSIDEQNKAWLETKINKLNKFDEYLPQTTAFLND